MLLTDLGAKGDFNERHFTDAVRSNIKAFNGAAKNVTVAALDWQVKKRDPQWQAWGSVAIAAREATFRTDELKSKRDPESDGAATVGLLLKTRNAAVERGLAMALTANGMEVGLSDSVTCHPTSGIAQLSCRRSPQDGYQMEARHRSSRDQAARGAEDGFILVGGEMVLHSRPG